MPPLMDIYICIYIEKEKKEEKKGAHFIYEENRRIPRTTNAISMVWTNGPIRAASPEIFISLIYAFDLRLAFVWIPSGSASYACELYT